MKLPQKFKNFTELLVGGDFYPIIKSADKFLSERFFDKKEFDDSAWYYNKDKVFDYLQKNIPTHFDRAWFEEDEFDVLAAYFKFLSNYELFILFLMIVYF